MGKMKNNESIRESLPRMIKYVIFVFIILVLPINILIQMNMQHKNQEERANEIFDQVERIIERNREDLEIRKDEFSQKSIMAAEMVAYFVEHNKGVTSDLQWTRELAKKLNVDEIHYFTPEGKIYFGTHPEYYGLSFDSGEQMSFFKPMIEDKNLKLCQDITPNTAEKKEMQYAAVWLKDKSQIIQIGLQPKRLLKEIEDKSLKNIFGNFPFGIRGFLHVYDKKKSTIVASTSRKITGLKIDSSFKKNNKLDEQGFHYNFDGKKYCVYMRDYGEYVLIRTYYSNYPIKVAFVSSGIFLVYLTLVSIVVIGIMSWYIDKKLLKNLTFIVDKLRKVEQGNLENIDIKTGLVEIDELIFYINQLQKSIRLNWGKLSHIIDRGKISIGIYEYNFFYKKFFINERLFEILGIENYEEKDSLNLAKEVRKRIEQAKKERVSPKDNIHRYDKNGKIIYLRIEKVKDEQSIIYYITDVSTWYEEINLLKDQSNKDLLTGLYNRRGFIDRLSEIFSESNDLGYGVMILLDADGLKKINDIYGHNAGDKYLNKIANIIKDRESKSFVCARLGGDEFVLFIYGKNSLEELHEEIGILKSKRGEIFIRSKNKVLETVEFSMGYSFYPMDSRDYTLLMDIADENMYQEKRERKIYKLNKNI